jgi:hypothetical protein
MTRKLMSLAVLAVMPAWAIGQEVRVVEARPVVVAATDEAGAAGGAHAVVTVDGEDGSLPSGHHVVIVKAVAEGDSPDNAPRVRVLTEVARAVDPNRGWLGVALGEMSGAQADKAGTDTGVVVLNVVKGSPAEVAGLQAEDVITSINGEAVGNVPDVANKIGELGPEASITLDVVRDGKPVKLTAQLTKAQEGPIEWLHAPDMVLKDRIYLNPGVLRIDPQGTFRFYGPHDVGDGTTLGTKVEISIDNGVRTVTISSSEDGEVTEVSQTGDGPIRVKRYAEGAEDEAEVVEYATADELASADPDAHALYKRQSGAQWTAHLGGADPLTFDFDVHTNWFHDDMHERIAEILKQSGVNFEELHKQIQDAMEDLPSVSGQGGAHAGFFMARRAATRTFKVQPDGQIELTVREGDTEVTTVYRDEADLQARNPEAYERFTKVQSAKVEE